MKLYNTMSRQLETVIPRTAGAVGMYACGLTAYDYTHLGHLRKYTMDDILVRTLEHEGLDVTLVQNVTDVGHLTDDGDAGEDKLEKGARKYGESVWDIARRFEEYFFYSMDLMGNTRPDVSCRATEHIEQQLEMVKKLEEKGFAYVIEGDGVYYDTSKFPDYGKLARLDLEGQAVGARVETVPGKRNPQDFALWKFERPGENRAMVWPSPWAERSFPGWHIECSAMAIEYLGEQFDIHTGGIDHISVHHTNEIAQAEAATEKEPFVQYWVHHNFLTVEGEKMSKSLDNFYTIDDVLERGYHPRALRLLFLSTHYRSEMNFTWGNLAGAHTALQKLVLADQSWRTTTAPAETLSAAAEEYLRTFDQAMAYDLNTPEAVAVLWEVVKDASLPAEQKVQLVQTFDQVLGLGLAEITPADVGIFAADDDALPSSIQETLEQRAAARSKQDWKRSDQLRDQLAEEGWVVEDTAAGQRVIAVTMVSPVCLPPEMSKTRHQRR